jgi:heme oxygenase
MFANDERLRATFLYREFGYEYAARLLTGRGDTRGGYWRRVLAELDYVAGRGY